ncbi:hypothetical protein [Streptomyces sp. NBC_00063]
MSRLVSQIRSVDLPALKTRLTASRDRVAAAAGVRLDGTWRPQPDSK